MELLISAMKEQDAAGLKVICTGIYCRIMWKDMTETAASSLLIRTMMLDNRRSYSSAAKYSMISSRFMRSFPQIGAIRGLESYWDTLDVDSLRGKGCEAVSLLQDRLTTLKPGISYRMLRSLCVRQPIACSVPLCLTESNMLYLSCRRPAKSMAHPPVI